MSTEAGSRSPPPSPTACRSNGQQHRTAHPARRGQPPLPAIPATRQPANPPRQRAWAPPGHRQRDRQRPRRHAHSQYPARRRPRHHRELMKPARAAAQFCAEPAAPAFAARPAPASSATASTALRNGQPTPRMSLRQSYKPVMLANHDPGGRQPGPWRATVCTYGWRARCSGPTRRPGPWTRCTRGRRRRSARVGDVPAIGGARCLQQRRRICSARWFPDITDVSSHP